MKTYLNEGWQFFQNWSEQILQGAKGESVRLPHSVATTPFNYYDESIYQFVSGYSRILHLDNTKGKTYLLTFDAVGHFAEVFVNGVSVATHACGYTAFTVDITPNVTLGDNLIAVKVDSRDSLNQPPFGFVMDYQTYGGIYRDVYLEEKQGAYVANAFVQAFPRKPIIVDVKLGNFVENVTLKAEILDGDETLFSSVYTVGQNAQLSIDKSLSLWSVDSPKLYKLRLTVASDVYETTFGVRSAEFRRDGFYLNGEKFKIVGLNRHQCFPYVGYAMPESMQRRDARILKNELCVNAVRTSHYPQSHYFIDECDRLGLLVFTEIPGWQHIGDAAWQEIAKNNVVEMIEQYRNHPSIILWGVRINESMDCDSLYEQTNAIAHRLDSTRQTGGVRYIRHSHLLEDVYTFNDFNRNGATKRKLICKKDAPYLVTEYNGHMFPTKSFDDAPHQREHVLRYARMLDGVFAASDTAGAFGWCMFDYNTHKDFGSGDRVCYHGVMDMFRNPKWASGVFSSLGSNPYLDVCFLGDIGDYPEGVLGDMYVMTNADVIKVYKGGVFIRDYTHADSPFKHLPNAPILLDDMIGERLTTDDGIKPKNARTLKRCLAIIAKCGINAAPLRTKLAIARVMVNERLTLDRLFQLYNKYAGSWGSAANELRIEAFKDGKLFATKIIGSMSSYILYVKASSLKLHETNTYDVAAVNIVAIDQNGNVCPYVSRAVKLAASGAIELIGPDNIALHGGRFGTYVKTKGVLGKGYLQIDDQTIEFEVV
ncbi:MAG: glycoside hydrolase family 2 protein [Clostridiales bacterium]|nr:glycoside hydrolase family 2 protein [Clostridiales bacterium]